MTVNEFQCRVIGNRQLTPEVFELTFDPGKPFPFKAGQFISIVIPGGEPGLAPLRRAYSLASAPGVHPVELCIQKLEDGPGSSFLSRLRPGEVFVAHAPYGFFVYHPKPGRDSCFVSTGTGIAPFRAMMLSEDFRLSAPRRTICLLGARREGDILYDTELSSLVGVRWVPCLSRELSPAAGRFKGRVTDFIRGLGPEMAWGETEFYLCGNGAMIQEVRAILKEKGVARESIHQEIYFRPGK